MLLQRCWHEDTTERPTFQEILDILQVEYPKMSLNYNTLCQNHVLPNEGFIQFGHSDRRRTHLSYDGHQDRRPLFYNCGFLLYKQPVF